MREMRKLEAKGRNPKSVLRDARRKMEKWKLQRDGAEPRRRKLPRTPSECKECNPVQVWKEMRGMRNEEESSQKRKCLSSGGS